ncbi:OprD family porin [Pseudomonas fulva]|nr:OprD family porin [Pseudomonas fulva]MBF8778143.1 OprD family porin [Pseudomonas fulva]
MNRHILAAAVASAIAGQAAAAGFIEDSQLNLTTRNFYINTDNRDRAPNKKEEWGQGFILNYVSGYTPGTVGFGLDAMGLLGIRLDSGGGTNGASKSSTGGTVFPSQSNGDAVRSFASLGPTLKAKISRTEAKVGTLMPKLPVLKANDGRLLPQSFQGAQITSNELDDFTFIGGRLNRVRARNSTDWDGMSIAGANGRKGQRSSEFYYGGADYRASRNLVLRYYYASLSDFYQQHFLGLTHTQALAVGTLKSDLQYYRSSPDGKNSSAQGRAQGYWAAGYRNAGEVDNHTWSALFTYSLASHAFSAGYQAVDGRSDFPFLNQGDGITAPLVTNLQIGKFQHAGERTWIARYEYDFAAIGIPGLTTALSYLKGDGIDQPGGDGKEWERDLALSYTVPKGTLKGMNVTWKNALLRSNYANVSEMGSSSQVDADENRLIVSYTWKLM